MNQQKKVAQIIKQRGESPVVNKQEHGTVFLEFAGRQAGIPYQERLSVSPEGETATIPLQQGDSRFQ